MKKLLLTVLSIFPFMTCIVHAEEVLVTLEHGKCFVLNMKPNSSLFEIEKEVEVLTGESFRTKRLILEMTNEEKSIEEVRLSEEDWNLKRHGQFLGHPRNYSAPLTTTEMNDIRYIVTSLANRSLVAIAIHRTSLEEAGERIDHIHPLKFLMFVFTDEELKVGMRNIRGRGWIWGDFIAGLKDSLATEAAIDNLKLEFIKDFSRIVSLEPKLLYPSVNNGNWDELIDTLITHVPRKGNHDRYNN